MRISIRLFAIFSALLLAACTAPCEAAVKIRLLAVNPSSDTTQKIPVRYDFPPEIQKEDVIDSGGMDIDYDVSSNVYYASKEIELAPKGTFTFQIIVADKWGIPTEQLDNLRNKLTEKLKALENTDQYDTAKLLAEKIQAKLDDIAKTQSEVSGDMEKKITQNRVNLQTLNELDNDILSLEYLANRAMPAEGVRTIKYNIEAGNPTDSPLETKITHFLPKGIKEDFISVNTDFTVHYDKDLDQFFLEKDETFKPHETKRYVIEIKDLWYFPEKLLASYQEQADSLNTDLTGTKFHNLAELIHKEIISDISEIRSTQAENRPLKDRIALYQINAEKEKRIKRNIDRMKTVLADALKHSVLREVKPMAQLRLIEYIKQVAPKVQVYKVVLYVLVFLIVFTIIAAIMWIARMKKEDSQKYKKIEKAKEKQQEGIDVNKMNV